MLVVGSAAFVARVGENEAESGGRGSVPAGEVPFAIAARGNPGAAKATHSANGARPWLNGGELVVFFIRDFAFLAHRSCPVAGKSPMACLLFVWVSAFPLFFSRCVQKREEGRALRVQSYDLPLRRSIPKCGYFLCPCYIYLHLCAILWGCTQTLLTGCAFCGYESLFRLASSQAIGIIHAIWSSYRVKTPNAPFKTLPSRP